MRICICHGFDERLAAHGLFQSAWHALKLCNMNCLLCLYCTIKDYDCRTYVICGLVALPDLVRLMCVIFASPWRMHGWQPLTYGKEYYIVPPP